MKADGPDLADLVNGTEGTEGAKVNQEDADQADAEMDTAEGTVEDEQGPEEEQGAEEEPEAEAEEPEEVPGESPNHNSSMLGLVLMISDSPALSIQPFRPHSSHAPAPSSSAVKALFGLEIKFAALRDRLYVERMEETAAEEEMILNGTSAANSTSAEKYLMDRDPPSCQLLVQEPQGSERKVTRSSIQEAQAGPGGTRQSPRREQGARLDLVDSESSWRTPLAQPADITSGRARSRTMGRV